MAGTTTIRSARTRLRDTRVFFRAWIRGSLRVGAVSPSGRGLAVLITSEITLASAPILELGPRAGAEHGCGAIGCGRPVRRQARACSGQRASPRLHDGEEGDGHPGCGLPAHASGRGLLSVHLWSAPLGSPLDT